MRSFETSAEQFENIFRLAVAYVLILGLFVFNVIAISYPFIGTIKAPLFLMVIYYWSVYRPTLMPLWFVFTCGIIMDLLGGLPLGLNALIYVGAHWIVAEQRRFLMSQSFALVWLGFSLLLLLVSAVQWAIFSLLQLNAIPFEPFIFVTLFGTALFPFICIMLHATHRILPAPPHDMMMKVS